MNTNTHRATFSGTFNGVAWAAESVAVEAVDTLTVVTTVRRGNNADVAVATLRMEGDRSDTVMVIEHASPVLGYHAGSIVARVPFGSSRREWTGAFKRAMHAVTNEAVWAWD